MKIKNINRIILVLFSGFFMSCATTSLFSPGNGNKYLYTYKLIHPQESSNLKFQDDSIIVQFKFDDAAIRFQLQNISESYLTIDWDKAAINIQGRYLVIRHASNLYSDTMRNNSILIPPLGYIRDFAIPRDNIYNDGDRWIEVDLLPTIDHKSKEMGETILKNVGRQLGFSLPLCFGSTAKNYEFDFQVDSVKRIPWKDYVPLQRIPEPPHPKHGLLGLDNVTTAIITVGVLGFSAYVLSIKKNPPSE
jgi:hypothetical protein